MTTSPEHESTPTGAFCLSTHFACTDSYEEYNRGMREIKFRFVNKFKDESKGYKIIFKTLEDLEGEDSWQGTLPYVRIAANQFTGIIADGVDVYEGDICETPEGIGVVGFAGGVFIITKEYKQGMTDAFTTNAHRARKVLGNIYENSELLNA